MNVWRKPTVTATLAVMAGLFTHFADAAIINMGPAPAVDTNTDCRLSNWSWDLTAAAAEAGPNRCTHWTMTPTSPAGAVAGKPPLPAGAKDLQFSFQHNAGPHAGDIPVNPPAGPVTVYAGRYAAGVKRAGALVVDHPEKHHDIFAWQVNVPAGGPPATITSIAKHLREGRPAGWSYNPADLGGPALINEVRASYKTDPERVVDGVPAQKVRHKVGGQLPNSERNNERPTDYSIRVTLGDPFFSDMTLAFVVGEEGNFEQADLGLMTEFFTGGAEYLVPMIFDAMLEEDLYLAVDLTQWLSFPTSYAPGDNFSFIDGISSALPGFMVATSPFSFSAESGFASDDLWTGEGIVLGEVDGHIVPEPASWALILGGLGGLAFARRRVQ